MGEGDDERSTGLEDAVHLAERPPEVDVVVHRVRRQDEVDRAARREAEVGEVPVVALHRDLGPGGVGAQVSDAIDVGVEGDHLGALGGQRDGVAGDPELDDALAARHVADEVELVVAGDVVAIGHGHLPSVARRGGPGASTSLAWR